MTNFDELLNSFQPQGNATESPLDFFTSTPEPKPATPEDLDLERLEGDIREIFNSRRFVNHVLVGLLGVMGSTAGVHLFAKLGIPALATTTLGGVVVIVAFGSALTAIRIEQGKPHIGGEFFVGLAQALGIAGSVYAGTHDYRELSSVAAKGKTQFLTEVKEFTITPQPPDFTRMGLAGLGLALLVLAVAVFKGRYT